MKSIRVVGDVHGLWGTFHKTVNEAEYSVCVGDYGFEFESYKYLDSDKHKLVGGNHDNYDLIHNCPNYLGDFGEYTLNGVKFFFIRGGFSLDWKERLKYEEVNLKKVFWKEEELSRDKMEQALDLYKRVKPEFVITHEAPRECAAIVGKPEALLNWNYNPATFTTVTQELLSACLKSYQPTLWIFGHYHRYKDFSIGRTRFICLEQVQYPNHFVDVNTNLDIINRR